MHSQPISEIDIADKISDHNSDSELLLQYIEAGSEAALTELITRYSGLVYEVCSRTSIQRVDAEDAFQTTFLILTEKANQIRNLHALSSWLYGVAHRTAVSIRKMKRQQATQIHQEQPASRHDLFQEFAQRYRNEQVDSAIASLDKRYREPILLFYLEDHSISEIATKLNKTTRSIEGLLRRGRQALKVKLIRSGISLPAFVSTLTFLGTQWKANTVAAEMIQATCSNCLQQSTLATTSRIYETLQHCRESSTMLTKTMMGPTGMIAGIALGALILTGPGTVTGGSKPATESTESSLVISTIFDKEHEEKEQLLEANPTPSKRTVKVDYPIPHVFEESGIDIDAAGVEFVEFDKAVTNSPDTSSNLNVGERIAPTVKEKREESIRQVLEEDVLLEFLDTPLSEVLDYFSEFHNIPIRINVNSLASTTTFGLGSDGISRHEPITLSSKQPITLESALNTILLPLNLDYIIENEMLTIVSLMEAEEHLVVRFYEYPHSNLDNYEETLTSLIAADSWEEVGGMGVIVQLNNSKFAIKQTERVHRQIEEFHNQLVRELAETPISP
ncbi:RNA polymerase sigma factor [Rubinisphaera italica]|uniref:RNA polymerase sigma factor n=1 Tax=Rubinisphaera italica TaxID=2527969 RepID=A0A5C5XJF6_9PLAN|nr:sigma-70 family RNA polymerase sigma factor [Rubinisphaera italica]TWT63327.1 RNA polymerase sigma factor [Rubinisphaera italica]